MRKKDNFYRRDPAKALSGMIGLSLEERGVYNTILDLLYSTWRPLEDDRRFIANWCGCAVQKLNPIIDRLIDRGRLITVEEGGRTYLSDDAFELERAAVKGAEKPAKSAEVGEKSGEVGEKSAGLDEKYGLIGGEGEQKQCDSSLEKRREEKRREDADASSGEKAGKEPKATAELVEGLWSCQPVCGGKRKATRSQVGEALAPALKRGGDPDHILAAFRAFYALPDCTRDGGRFAMGAAVLLNGDKWRDFVPGSAVEPEPRRVWTGPAKVIDILARGFDREKAESYAAAYCTWQDVPYEALIVSEEAMAKMIRSKCGPTLEAAGISIVIQGRAA